MEGIGKAFRSNKERCTWFGKLKSSQINIDENADRSARYLFYDLLSFLNIQYNGWCLCPCLVSFCQ
jgi:hypothetical protein